MSLAEPRRVGNRAGDVGAGVGDRGLERQAQRHAGGDRRGQVQPVPWVWRVAIRGAAQLDAARAVDRRRRRRGRPPVGRP